MVIGCMRLTDVTCFEVQYDSDRVTAITKNSGWAACTERTAQGKDFELIPTVKTETRGSVWL